MSTCVSAEAHIALPIDGAWQLLRDLSLATHYVPGLTECRLTTDLREGVGASRRVVSKLAGAMDETVTEWHDGRGFVIRLHRGEDEPSVFRDASFQYAIAPDGNATRATLTLCYTPKWGLLGRILDALFLRRFSARSVRETALGLARYYEASAAPHST